MLVAISERKAYLTDPNEKPAYVRNSLEVQWLGLGTFTSMGLGLIPGWGTKILKVKWHAPTPTPPPPHTKSMAKLHSSPCLHM